MLSGESNRVRSQVFCAVSVDEVFGLSSSVLSNSCLSKRIPDAQTLQRQIQANLRERNAKSLPAMTKGWQFGALL
jgi:hypothetical protein